MSLFFLAIASSIIGSLLGLGGGIVLIPAMVIFYHIPMPQAIAASLVAVIATSSSSAISNLKNDFINLRLVVFLELATVSGAVIGSLLQHRIPVKYLFYLFSAILLQSVFLMIFRRKNHKTLPNHSWAQRFSLNPTIPTKNQLNPPQTGFFSYPIARLPLGFSVMIAAGVLSPLLGIGSGVFKVLAMDSIMGLPLKVSSATSAFMIGVTAMTGAFVYFLNGTLIASIAAPVAVGSLLGAFIGAKLLRVIPVAKLRFLFISVLLIFAGQMLWKGFTTP